MKRKDLIKEIKFKGLNDFKDVNIDISNIDIEEPVLYTKKSFSLKRGVALTFASIFILITGFFIYSFNVGNAFSDVTPLNSETEFLGFQTVSGAALISSYDITELSYTDSFLEPVELSQTTFDITDELDLLSDYINMAETMFGSSHNYIYNDIESNNPDYEYAFDYKGMDLGGNLIEYSGYYNKNIDETGIELTNGILINNQKTYTFTQMVSNSLSKFTVYVNTNNYVEVINMSLENSQSFQYNVYKGNQLYNSSVVNISQFQNDFEATITITNKYNKQLELKVTNQNDFDGFNIQYNYNNNQSGKIKVNLVYDETSQMYRYQFEFENQTMTANRFEKGNKPAEDDDFINMNNSNDNQTTNDDSTGPGSRRNALKTTPVQTTYL